jgi:hypothetical protein
MLGVSLFLLVKMLKDIHDVNKLYSKYFGINKYENLNELELFVTDAMEDIGNLFE